jgi:hypothetical protein
MHNNSNFGSHINYNNSNNIFNSSQDRQQFMLHQQQEEAHLDAMRRLAQKDEDRRRQLRQHVDRICKLETNGICLDGIGWEDKVIQMRQREAKIMMGELQIQKLDELIDCRNTLLWNLRGNQPDMNDCELQMEAMREPYRYAGADQYLGNTFEEIQRIINEEEVMILGLHKDYESEAGGHGGKMGERKYLKRLIGVMEHNMLMTVMKMSGHDRHFQMCDGGRTQQKDDAQLREKCIQIVLDNPGNFWRCSRLLRIQEVQQDHAEWPLRWTS